MTELYKCEPYFERLEKLYLDDNMVFGRGRSRYWKRHPLKRLKAEAIWLVQAIGLFLRLMKGVPEAHLSASTASGSGGSSRSARTRPRCCSTSSIWPSTTTPTRMAKQMSSGRTRVLQLVLISPGGGRKHQAFSQDSSHRHASSCISALNSWARRRAGRGTGPGCLPWRSTTRACRSSGARRRARRGRPCCR